MGRATIHFERAWLYRATLAAPVIELTQKNACAIVSGKLAVSDSPGGKLETCMFNYFPVGILPPHPHVTVIQFL